MNSMHVQIQLGDSQNYAKLHLKKNYAKLLKGLGSLP
jgi:hypothetical protein